MNMYKVNKAISHNVVEAVDVNNNEECMLLGKGIGFGAKPGDSVDNSKVEKKYFIKDSSNLNKYQQLIKDCDQKLFFIVEEYIGKINAYFGCSYDESLHIGLLDHLNFALYRYNKNVIFSNIFIDEISVLYEKEYDFAKIMLEDINKRLNVTIPHAEAGFIALHIHSSIGGEKAANSSLLLKIIKECIEHIEACFQITFPPKSLDTARLITHLKFSLKRASDKKSVSNLLIETIKTSYPNSFKVAKELSEKINDSYGVYIPEEEVGYLAVHIERIVASVKG